MRFKRIHIELIAAAILLSTIAWAVLANSYASTGKPTGTTYAWLTCKSFLSLATYAAQSDDSRFDAYKLDEINKSDLKKMSQAWHNGADFLVRTNFHIGETNKEIVIVSNWAMESGRPAIWNFFKKTPSHVVGYSDGSTGLVSPDEFAHLNLNGFALLSNLVTNSGFSATK